MSTDLIVGFPSEGEDDFQKTLDVLKAVEFSQVYAFKYSPRPNTRAAKMEDNVLQKTKEERLANVLDLFDKIRKLNLKSLCYCQKILLSLSFQKSFRVRRNKPNSLQIFNFR